MKKTLMFVATSLCFTLAYAADTAGASTRPAMPQHIQAIVDVSPNLVARIKPVGSACVEGEECAVKVTKALDAAVEGVIRTGDVIYDGVCAQCHADGLIGAPKMGDAAAWSARVAKGSATLYNHAINGFNSMPARGGADISDAEVKNAVDYMVNGSK